MEGLPQEPFGPTRASPLYRAESARALDAVAIQSFHIPGITLMERAGRQAFAAFRRRWPRGGRLAIACGPGNNGGDGFVVARLAADAGWWVSVFVLDGSPPPAGDAALALAAMEAAGLGLLPASTMDPDHFDAVVDGLFGTGLTRPLAGEAAKCVGRINAVAGPRLALDIPSGLHGDTGQALGACVHADLTVTFIAGKPGLYTAQAVDHVGEIVVADLDLPFAVVTHRSPDAWRLAFRDLLPMLGPRAASAHKGAFGRVLIVGGEHGFAGAARMAGEAAARVGAGLTSIATRASHVSAVLAGRPELMVRGVDAVPDLEPMLERGPVLGIGPGLGTGEWGRALLARGLELASPLVVDADALNLLAHEPALAARLRSRRLPALLTPHPGEAARLLGCSVADVEADRFAAAASLGQRFGAVVLLKGAGTIVQAPHQAPVICVGGHPAMASGGMGDVLTGVLCALLAQGLPLAAAAVRGALIHARAAERARFPGSLQRGVLAGDLMAELPRLARGV